MRRHTDPPSDCTTCGATTGDDCNECWECVFKRQGRFMAA